MSLYVEQKGFHILSSTRFKEVEHQAPSFLQDIGEVVAATVNPKKLDACISWINSYGIIRGAEPLQVTGIKVFGEEPEWHDAFRVSTHKTLSAVYQLNRNFGPERMVVGFDTVHFRNGIARYNLSRQDITGPRLVEAADEIVRDYGVYGAEPRWDNAMCISRHGLLAATGESWVARMKAIPEELIREFITNNTGDCINKNAGLPLIDHPIFEPYIDAIGVFSMASMVDHQTGKLREWHLSCNAEMVDSENPMFRSLLAAARTAIVGGVPSKSSLKKIEQLHPRSRTSGLLIV